MRSAAWRLHWTPAWYLLERLARLDLFAVMATARQPLMSIISGIPRMPLSRCIKAILLSAGSLGSLLLVLAVNNGLDLIKIGSAKSLAAPRIKISVEDSCNSIIDVQVTVNVTPDLFFFTIESTPSGHATCKEPPMAGVEISNLALRLADGTTPPEGYVFPYTTGLHAHGKLQKAEENHSNFVVHLTGDGRTPDGSFTLANDALDVGFGERAAQVVVSTRNLECPDVYWDPQFWPDITSANRCLISLRGVLLYANSAFDLASAIPPVDRLTEGGNLSRIDKQDDSYDTTRLVWSGQPRPRNGYIPESITGFEFHLVNRYSVAQRQFITVAFSAVFGTLLSMLFALPLEKPRSDNDRRSGESDGQSPNPSVQREPPPEPRRDPEPEPEPDPDPEPEPPKPPPSEPHATTSTGGGKPD